MTIKVKHTISDTEREIYVFEDCSDCFRYMGIYYSRRNDANDLFGDEWEEFYKEEREKALKEFEDYDDDYYNFNTEIEKKIKEIKNKYNPIVNKTKFGKPYYSGQYGGKLPAPKLTEQEIKDKILEKISCFGIKID